MRRKRCSTETTVELVHKQITPVAPKTLYQEAIATGEFVGTFKEFLEYMKGPVAEESEPASLKELLNL